MHRQQADMEGVRLSSADVHGGTFLAICWHMYLHLRLEEREPVMRLRVGSSEGRLRGNPGAGSCFKMLLVTLPD